MQKNKIRTSQCLQKRTSKLVLSLPEHKKNRGFSVFAPMVNMITAAMPWFFQERKLDHLTMQPKKEYTSVLTQENVTIALNKISN